MPLRHRLILWSVKRRVKKVGEPWRSSFAPDELARDLRSMGFTDLEDHTPEALNARYFANRADGLRVGWLGNVMWAGS
jgi:O-methyltransferase involved in polyketide biosynthesis